MARFTDEELKAKVEDGYIVESVEEMTEGYRKSLVVQLTVQADTELMSGPAYWMAARHAPSANTQVSAHAIIQDELAHANIAYRLLEDLGESKEYLVYEREPHDFKHPYGFDQPLDNWAELVVANGFFDRAGISLLADVHENTSYGPLKRALIKVSMEETFHLRHGEVWMKRLTEAGGEARDMVQRAVDWMFPMTLEWFGLPDDLKRHSGQLDYKLKGGLPTTSSGRSGWPPPSLSASPSAWTFRRTTTSRARRTSRTTPSRVTMTRRRSAGSSRTESSRGTRCSSAGRPEDP